MENGCFYLMKTNIDNKKKKTYLTEKYILKHWIFLACVAVQVKRELASVVIFESHAKAGTVRE